LAQGGAKRLGLRALLRRFRNRLNVRPLEKSAGAPAQSKTLARVHHHAAIPSDALAAAHQDG